MDDADLGLEGCPQSVRHPVRGQGAGMNTSYTVNLTPPIPPVSCIISIRFISCRSKTWLSTIAIIYASQIADNQLLEAISKKPE